MNHTATYKKLKLSLNHARLPFFCPKCDVEMDQVVIFGVSVEQCRSCEGMFFDKGETEKVVHRKLRFKRLKRWFGI